MAEFTAGTRPHSYWQVDSRSAQKIDGGVIDEILLSIYVNLQEVATIMCSPVDQEALVVGFLHNEGVIQGQSDVGLLKMNVARTVADVILTHSNFSPPRRLTITSGCGGGVTLQNLSDHHPPIESDFVTTPETILALLPDMQSQATLYRQVRGVHTAVLMDTEQLILSTEDVGRHNTVDKIAGLALQQNIDTRDKILMTSGRISSEMATKARRLQTPIVVSRTSPTAFAVHLADLWGICLIGYARRGQFRIYTHPERLGIRDDTP